ncbi:MAG: polynucleotide adenylyltransferase [Desulfobulbus propionicus]|nr:MAG: polynucleotide adenylyltransferase [Desulfobulbus propionicus]
MKRKDRPIPGVVEMGTALPAWLYLPLQRLQQQMQAEVYLAGGTVRDLVLGRTPHDLDLVVPDKSHSWARALAKAVGGAFVPLGGEDAARVVFQGQAVDVSSFRDGSLTIEEDLAKRDLSINAMAICLTPFLRHGVRRQGEQVTLLDPCGGLLDIEQQVIRCPDVQILHSDPLRMLRVYRFSAALGFRVEVQTARWVGALSEELRHCAPERICHEFRLILESENSAAVIGAMAEAGLLWVLFPELERGVGMQQPASHHLDVFSHNLETLRCLESLLRDPCYGYAREYKELAAYLAVDRQRTLLKWAALFHDVGKPVTRALNQEGERRITFYNHDQAGQRIFNEIALRLRLSNWERNHVGQLIGLHMRPFHLIQAAKDRELSIRACSRLIRKAGRLIPGLFLLALADTMAGKGEDRPATLEQDLEAVVRRVLAVERDHVQPALRVPPLIDGHDLIHSLGLQPGPVFKEILEAVEEARIEGQVQTKDQALSLASSLVSGEQ